MSQTESQLSARDKNSELSQTQLQISQQEEIMEEADIEEQIRNKHYQQVNLQPIYQQAGSSKHSYSQQRSQSRLSEDQEIEDFLKGVSQDAKETFYCEQLEYEEPFDYPCCQMLFLIFMIVVLFAAPGCIFVYFLVYPESIECWANERSNVAFAEKPNVKDD